MNFSLKTKICNFFYEKIELLGHKIFTEVIYPLERNIKAITKFIIPRNIKDI